MGTALVTLSLGLLVFVAHLFAGLFEKARIPDVLLLVLIGLLAGPVTGLVPVEVFGGLGNIFAIVTLVIILFDGGLGLSFSALRESMGRGVRLSIIGFIGTLLVFAPLSILLFKMSVLEGLILSAIIGGTCSAIVIPMVSRLHLQPDSRTALILESTFSDVLCIVVTLALIQMFQYHQLQPTLILGGVIASFLLAALIGTLAAFFWSSVLSRVRQLQNSIFLTPAFVFIVYGITEILGYSGAIAALTFGILLGNIQSLQYLQNLPMLKELPFLRPIRQTVKLGDTEKAFFDEIVFLLRTFFFVYIGLSIRLNDPRLVLAGLGLTLAIFLLRIPVVLLSIDKATTRFDASIAAVMTPKGLAAAVLASLPLQAGIESSVAIQDVTYAVILFSIAGSALLTFLVERSRLRRFYGLLFSKYAVDASINQETQGEVLQ